MIKMSIGHKVFAVIEFLIKRQNTKFVEDSL